MDNIRRVYAGWNINSTLWVLLSLSMAWYGEVFQKISSFFSKIKPIDTTEIIVSTYSTVIVIGILSLGFLFALYLKHCRKVALTYLCKKVLETDGNFMDTHQPHELRQQLYNKACQYCDKLFDVPLKGIEETLIKKCETPKTRYYRYFTDRVNGWKIFDYYRKEFKLTPEHVQNFLNHIGMNENDQVNEAEENVNLNVCINKKIDLLVNWIPSVPQKASDTELQRKHYTRSKNKFIKTDLNISEKVRRRGAPAKKVVIKGHRLKDIKPNNKMQRCLFPFQNGEEDQNGVTNQPTGKNVKDRESHLRGQIKVIKVEMRRLEDHYQMIKEKKSETTVQKNRAKSETDSSNLLLILRSLLVEEAKVRSEFERDRQILFVLRGKLKQFLRAKAKKAAQDKAKESTRQNKASKSKENDQNRKQVNKSARKSARDVNTNSIESTRKESTSATKTPRNITVSDTKIKKDTDNVARKNDYTVSGRKKEKSSCEKDCKKYGNNSTLQAKKTSGGLQQKARDQCQKTPKEMKTLNIKKSVSSPHVKVESSKNASDLKKATSYDQHISKKINQSSRTRKDLLKTPRKTSSNSVTIWNNTKDPKSSIERSKFVLQSLESENIIESTRHPSKTPRKTQLKESPTEVQQTTLNMSDDQSIKSLDSEPKLKKKVLKKKVSSNKLKSAPTKDNEMFHEDNDHHRESDDTVYRKNEFINNFVAQSRRWNEDQLLTNAEDINIRKNDLIATMVKFFHNQRFDKYNPYQEEMENKKREFLIKSLEHYQQRKSLQELTNKTVEEELREKEEFENRLMNEIMEAAYAEFRKREKIDKKLSYCEGLEYENEIAQKKSIERNEMERERKLYEQRIIGANLDGNDDVRLPYMDSKEAYNQSSLEKELEFHQKEMERIKQKQQVSTGRNESSAYDLEMNSNYQALADERAIRGSTREDILKQLKNNGDSNQQHKQQQQPGIEMDMQQRQESYMKDLDGVVPQMESFAKENENEQQPMANENECQQQEEEDDSDRERQERRRMEEEREKKFEEIRKTLLANDRSCRRQMEIQLPPPDSVNAPIFAAKNPVPISPVAFTPIDFGTDDFIKRITEESTPFQPYKPREDGQPNDAAPEVGRVMKTRESHMEQAYAHIRVTDMLNLPSGPNDGTGREQTPATPAPTTLASIKAMQSRQAILKKLSGETSEPCCGGRSADGQKTTSDSTELALYQPPGALQPLPLDIQARRVKLAASKCGETVAFKDVLTDTTYISSSKAVQLPNEFISTGARAKAVLLQLGMDTEIQDSEERHGKAVNLWSTLSQKRIANSQPDPFEEEELRPPTYITLPHIHMEKIKKPKEEKKYYPPPPPPPPFISPYGHAGIVCYGTKTSQPPSTDAQANSNN